MKKFLILIIVFGTASIYSQTTLPKANLDSLWTVWQDENQNDSLRSAAYEEYVFSGYIESVPDSAILMADELINFSKERNYDRARSYGYNIKGYVYYEKSNYFKALEHFKKALAIEESRGRDKFNGSLLNTIGVVYGVLGNQAQALEYYEKALKVAEEIGDKEILEMCISNIGEIYFELDNYPRAIEYFERGLQLEKEMGDSIGYAMSLNLISDVYRKQRDFSSALDYSEQALKIYEKFDFTEGIASSFYSIGDTYKEQKEYSLAIQYFKNGLENNQGSGSSELKVMILNKMGSICREQSDYTKALSYCKQSKNLASKIGMLSQEKNACECLYLTYRSLNKVNYALEYLEQIRAIDDSLNTQEANNRLQQMEIERQALKDSITASVKERQIVFAHQEEVQKKNRSKNIAIVGALFILLIAAGLFSRLRFVRKSRALLAIEKNRAEKSEQIKQDFLANMSHEIRTPMNAVLGMTNLVLDTSLDKKQQYYLKGIKTSGDNLLHIINDILDLSKMEAGKMELDCIDFSIRETVEQVKQMLQHRAQEKDIELLTLIDTRVDDIVIGDPMRLNQVLINLIGNAIKFTTKGSVTIRVFNENGGVRFNITDTGIGIPDNKLQSVFESFTQANTSDTRNYGGTGLGLSISQQLVKLMDSTIEIKSKEGYGSTFSFTINFEKGSLESLKERLSKDEMIDGSILDGLKILLVDDNEYNIIVARDTLKSKADLEIIEAYNGQEAIDVVKENDFDVVLMDVQMPVMNGFDATQYIRKNFDSPKKEIPIIALTASVLRTDLDKCMDAGMNSYIPKPFKTHQLIGEIAEVLNIELKKKKKVEIVVPQTETGEITDLSFLNNFCEGDKDRIKKYIDMFIKSVPIVSDNIDKALNKKDFTSIANHTHGFKTKCMMMGMSETKDLVNSIEIICRETPDEELIKDKILKLNTNIEKAVIELRNYLKK